MRETARCVFVLPSILDVWWFASFTPLLASRFPLTDVCRCEQFSALSEFKRMLAQKHLLYQIWSNRPYRSVTVGYRSQLPRLWV